MNSVKIQLKLFGAFRERSPSPEINIEMTRGSSLKELRQHLASSLGELIHDSALANHSEILKDSYVIEDSMTLAVLPPVCGG
jgi:molybdopterin converting factor small subunit